MVLQPRGAWRSGVVGAQRQQLQQQNPAGAAAVLRRLTPGAQRDFRDVDLLGGDALPPSRSTRLRGLDRPSLWAGAFEVPVLRERGPGSGGNRPLAATARISSSSSRIPDRLAAWCEAIPFAAISQSVYAAATRR